MPTTRFDRFLPWALVAAMGSMLLLGLAWDASFEATPANSDLVSQGDDRIRELKVEIADRGEGEHCWGTSGTGGCASDLGFHRIGSARAFNSNTAPTTRLNLALTALGGNDGGRLWVDNDGPDNVATNNDDGRLSYWDGAAWDTARWEALSGIVLTSIANGDILKYNGTDLVNTAVASLMTRDQGGFQADETFTNGVCSADCTGAGVAVPDHSGGSDTNGYPEVTVPSTPAGVTRDIYVYGRVFYQTTSGNAGNIICTVQMDVNDADTFAAVQDVFYFEGISNAAGLDRECIFNSVLAGVTAGSRYAFRVQMTDTGSLTADWDVNPSTAPSPVPTASLLVAEVRPRSVF